MATTYTLISSSELSSSAASVTFSSIPATYTDLVLKVSARATSVPAYENMTITFNGSTASNYSMTWLQGDGANATSSRQSATTEAWLGYISSGGATANTFGSVDIYISNYAGSNKKPFSTFPAQETNATTAYIKPTALLWGLTDAITSLTLDVDGGSFASGSSFYLYGIKNS